MPSHNLHGRPHERLTMASLPLSSIERDFRTIKFFQSQLSFFFHPPRSFSCPTRLRSDGQPPFPFPSGSLISPFVHGATGCFRGSPVPFSPGSSPRASSSFSLVILLLGYYAPYFLLYILLQLSFIFFFLFDLFRSLHPFFSFYCILLNIFSSLYFR